jgi:hypothetical protein
MGSYDTAVVHWETDVAPPYESSIKTYSILVAHTKPLAGVRTDAKNGFGIISINPNPAQTSFTIHYVSTQQAAIHLFDALGRDMFTTSLSSGENEQLISLPSLASGSYVLRLVSSEGVREQTIVITR